MKVVKRSSVFETNSSSVHSVTKTNIKSNYDYNQPLNFDRIANRVRVTAGDFGWGYGEYNDAETKLSYALTMALEIECRNERIKNLEDFINSDSYKMINDTVAYSCNCDGIECYGVTIDTYESSGREWVCYDGGYIDHQSSERYITLDEWLNDMNVTLDEFIFDTSSKLLISSDN